MWKFMVLFTFFSLFRPVPSAIRIISVCACVHISLPTRRKQVLFLDAPVYLRRVCEPLESWYNFFSVFWTFFFIPYLVANIIFHWVFRFPIFFSFNFKLKLSRVCPLSDFLFNSSGVTMYKIFKKNSSYRRNRRRLSPACPVNWPYNTASYILLHLNILFGFPHYCFWFLTNFFLSVYHNFYFINWFLNGY